MAKKPTPPTDPATGPATDDGALWDGVAASVRELKGREFMRGSADADLSNKNKKSPPPPPGKQPKKKSAQPPSPQAAAKPKAPLPELSHASQPGLDKSTERRMARGKVKIEARLDLHGMTQSEAQPALESFIEHAYLSNKREVIVVTGKGTKLGGEIGVLRKMTPDWLNREPTRSRIVAFTHAAAKDGGEGALYIRIRKQNK